MSTRMVSRGGKTRFFGFVCMLLVFSAVLYVFHGTQVELDDVRHSAASCTHQLESISSQLQVIVELKSKFERSLEDEKLEHAKTKDELNAIIQDEKQLRDKQNVNSMDRYNELERNHEALQEEDKKLREELEKFKLNYLEEENKNKQLAKDLNTVIDQVQNLKKEKEKLNNVKQNDNDQNNNLQKSNDYADVKFEKKLNVSKSGSSTPPINPQAIDGTTAKSSTPMINFKVTSINESLSIENDDTNPINQPSMDIISVNSAVVSQNETSSTHESQVNGNESMRAMPAPPQEDTVKKEQLNNNEEDQLAKQKNMIYNNYELENNLKEDEDDEDEFDNKEDNQHNMRYVR